MASGRADGWCERAVSMAGAWEGRGYGLRELRGDHGRPVWAVPGLFGPLLVSGVPMSDTKRFLTEAGLENPMCLFVAWADRTKEQLRDLTQLRTSPYGTALWTGPEQDDGRFPVVARFDEPGEALLRCCEEEEAGRKKASPVVRAREVAHDSLEEANRAMGSPPTASSFANYATETSGGLSWFLGCYQGNLSFDAHGSGAILWSEKEDRGSGAGAPLPPRSLLGSVYGGPRGIPLTRV